MFGYCGRILRIDLSKKEIRTQNFGKAFAKKYIGGIGFCAKLIYDEVPGEIDAYDPRNRIVFSVGPLTASRWPSSSNFVVCSKSPLVCNPDTLLSAWGNSEAKGSFGLKMKASGYDSIVVSGKSDEPVYLHVTEDEVKIRDAEFLWGKGTFETQDILQKDLGKDCSIACIGPAGENLVRFGCILSSPGSFAGRCGMGAVLGSKKLKAIVAEGSGTVEIARPDKLTALTKRLLPKILGHEHTKGLIYAGTPSGLEAYVVFGDTPLKNWVLGSWDKAEKIGGDALNERYGRKRRFCPYCSIGCKRDVKLERKIGPVAPFDAPGPEYESLATLGALNLIDDLDIVVASNHLCNDLGMDTISAGGTASFAFECYEKGLITCKDTDGLKLIWGESDVLPWLLWKIGHREGIGNLLAEGSLRASRKIGCGSSQWCIEVKGVELPGHDPRAMDSFGLSYALAPEGANHIEIPLYFFEIASEGVGYAAESADVVDPSLGIMRLYPRWGGEGKGRGAALAQNLSVIKSSLCVCLMAIFNVKFADYCDAYNYVTGFDLTNQELLECCERIVNLRRAFNCKCGLTAKHDYLPRRILTQSRPDGGSADHVPNLEQIIKEYYVYRGWDHNTGKPRKEKLMKLDLPEVVKDLYLQ